MALAERLLAAEFNRPGHAIVDHRTYAFCGDGCLMEGISHEAGSFAGTQGLNKLTCIYDDNGISIDGETKGWFTEDVGARFEAYGWHVIRHVDGHDPAAVAAALTEAQKQDKPTLIRCRTVIGFGSPNKQGTAEAHGAALGPDEVSLARRTLNWSYGPFEIPDAIYKEWDCRPAGAKREESWNALMGRYRDAFPDLPRELDRRIAGDLPKGWSAALDSVARAAQDKLEDLETRKSSQRCLNAIAPALPELIGGSADLTGSNNTDWKGCKVLTRESAGNYMHYGVREFGMTALTNGITLHGGFVPFSATFLMFMEYARNAVRLASLMGIRHVLVYTHDSVALGEDGPTHQPVEQLTNLRTTPHLSLWRPCDTVETSVAWRHAISRRTGPTALVFTRQKTKAQPRSEAAFKAIERGGYVLVEESAELQAVVIATGSEVALAVAAAKKLADDGIGVRVVSMPSTDVFLAQDDAYRESVIPTSIRARVAVEAAHPDYWYRFVGLDGAVVGIDRFGLSGKGADAMEALGMTVDHVVAAIRSCLGGKS
jgi:transketolase